MFGTTEGGGGEKEIQMKLTQQIKYVGEEKGKWFILKNVWWEDEKEKRVAGDKSYRLNRQNP